MNYDEIAQLAQKISFSFEDHFEDKEKRGLFNEFFNQYLSLIDPTGVMEPYDAIIALGRKNPSEFEQMVQEMQKKSLISD
jgi:hypothetical protein